MRPLLLCAALLLGCDTGTDAAPKASSSKTAHKNSQKNGSQKKAGSQKNGAVKKTANSAGASSGHQLPGYDGIFRNDPKLAPTRVAQWNEQQLRIKRNEVYARYGRAFQSADLTDHFRKQSWYTVRDAYSDAWLTDHDRENVSLIQAFEAKPKHWDGQVGELMFMSRTELVISDADSLYGHEGEERNYVARGSKYVITWAGPSTFDLRKADQPELWTWTGSGWRRDSIVVPKG
jgi:hypothetical protein